MSYLLERIIYGLAEPAGEMTILALSDHLTPQDAALWRGITSLKPLDAPSFNESRTYGIFAGPGDRFVMACAYQFGLKPYYEYILLPRELLTTLAGNLSPLLELFAAPPKESLQAVRIPPIKLTNAEPWSSHKRRAQVEKLLNQYGDMRRMLHLLGAALHERGLMIHDFAPDTTERLALVRGLMALVPAPLRADLTFSTNRHEKTMTQARIVFSSSSVVTGRWIANWSTQSFPNDEALDLPYIQRLKSLWHGDLNNFLGAIDQMDRIAAITMTNRNLQNSLTVMAERQALDAQIQAGDEVPPEAIKAVMKDIPPEGDLKRLYARRLLRYALEARDAEAALIVARAMDEDPQLDKSLNRVLMRDLAVRPDAVYSFIRTRLGVELDPRWAERLKVAALASLRVAILDGDPETVINWLRLVVREPASYDLADILHNGILAAQERARREPELAQGLVLLAIKRDQAALDVLLQDEALVAILPNTLGQALREGDADPILLLQTYGVEVFLVALGHGLHPDLLTPEAVEQVWALYTGANPTNGAIYTPERIVNALADGGAARLTSAALQALLGLMLRDKRDDLTHQVIRQATRRDDFLSVLAGAINESERSELDALALIAQMLSVGDLALQDSVDVYIGLLIAWDWRRSALEVMEQVARAIQQHPDLQVEAEVIWRLLAIAAEMKEEFIARVTLRYLMTGFEALEDEVALADDLLRLLPLIGWSSAARTQLLTWWRPYIREQATARLLRLDKALSEFRQRLPQGAGRSAHHRADGDRFSPHVRQAHALPVCRRCQHGLCHFAGSGRIVRSFA